MYDQIKEAMLNAVTVMEMVHLVPEGSVAKLSNGTSNTRLPADACAHATIEDVMTTSFFGPIPPNSLSRARIVPNVLMYGSTRLSSSRMSLEHTLAGFLDNFPQISFQASHAIGEMFKMGDECKDKYIRAITS